MGKTETFLILKYGSLPNAYVEHLIGPSQFTALEKRTLKAWGKKHRTRVDFLDARTGLVRITVSTQESRTTLNSNIIDRLI